MIFCPVCEFEIGAGDNFCAKCGCRLKNKDDVKTIKNLETWNKDPKGRRNSLWTNFCKGLKHTFSDSDEPTPKGRKIINVILLIAIILVSSWILSPNLDSININLGSKNKINDDCTSWLNAKDLFITEAKFYESDLRMEVLITNNKEENVTISNLAKTYEFREDKLGDTELEELSITIPSKKTLKLSFNVKSKPFIIGIELSGCEKIKVSEWDVIN